MKIILSPVRTDDLVTYEKRGDTIIVNGEEFDLSPVEEGDQLPATAIDSPWFGGGVTRARDELVLTLILPNPWNYSPEQAFPEPLFDVQDGIIELPPSLPDPEPEQEIEIEGEPINE